MNAVSKQMLTTAVELRDLHGQIVDVPQTLRAKATKILSGLESRKKVMVAFSGGIDSTLVTYLAKLALNENAIAVTADSPSLPQSELQETKTLAAQMGVKHLIIRTEELSDPNYVSNPSNRCYFCKKELGEKLTRLAESMGGYVLLDGTNAEDLKGHRPGAAALSERGILRPLAEAGMSKDEVRELSRYLGLPNFNKPSMPCLSSRVQYGEIITPERLRRIERAEDLIHSLVSVKDLRVRDHGNLARIEVGKDERELLFNKELFDRIANSLRQLGFTYVTLDMLGYRSGSMNELAKAKGP